jgi:uncharacterized repeat protein (TIGR03803 family)
MKKAFITISCLTRRASIVFMFLAVTTIVAPTQTFTTLANFDSSNGSNPTASLIQGSDGNLYGTTDSGGGGSFCFVHGGCGTIFQITPAGTLTTLYNFCSQSGCTDGIFPYGGLVQGTDGNFYGTTIGGGVGNGTVFKITPGGTLTTLHIFDVNDGGSPRGTLVQGTDGNFYGTTTDGGANFEGSVFVITPDGTLTTVASLGANDEGGAPYAGPIQGTDGSFYGTATSGGIGNGMVFKVTPTGTLTMLYSFCSQSGCTDGTSPFAGLVQGADGNFYGATSSGGDFNACSLEQGCGTIFKIGMDGTLTTLHAFESTDGFNAQGTLAQGSDGNFYGTTFYGGANNFGTVFTVTPTGILTSLHSFNQTDGSMPYAGLVQATNGKFYGTTSSGGSSSNCDGGCGTVFSLDVGLGGGAAVTLSRSSLTFAKQAINTTSTAKSITLTNTGTIPLVFNNVAISGDFAVSASTCGATLAVAMKCRISVAFTPKQLGPLTGTLTITDNAANSPQTVALSGSGVLPVTLTPASATYPKRTVGTTSPPKTFTLTNYQTVTLDSIAIGTTGDFAVSATTCTTSLPSRGKCKISVTFTPTGTGTRTGQLSVSDSASNSPQTSSLTGTGK